MDIKDFYLCQGAITTLCSYEGQSGIRFQGVCKKWYVRTQIYFYEIYLWKPVYKQLLETWEWKNGVNEKTFLAKSLYKQMVGLEYNGETQTGYGFMFNMIFKDGTRSDNAFTFYGRV